MLTGRRTFGGEGVTDTLASVVKDQPDVGKAPPQVRRLLRKCLEKDPKRRLRDLGDAWDLIEAQSAPLSRAWIAWSVAGVLALAVAELVFVQARLATGTRGRRMHLSVPLPGDGWAPSSSRCRVTGARWWYRRR